MKVIAVVGMGGVGKSTIARKIFEDHKANNVFHSHAWIPISLFNAGEPSGFRSLLRSLISRLFRDGGEKVDEDLNNMMDDQLTEIVRDYLENKKYLIVLDDMQSPISWDKIRSAFPNGLSGRNIIVTTSIHSVAELCQRNNPGGGHIQHLEPLPPDDSLSLFCHHAFGSDTCPPNLEQHSRMIVQRCGGLPLAIKSVGNLVAKKKPKSATQWARVLETLNSEMESQGHLGLVQSALTASYNNLPNHLKPCFLCFSIFPRVKASRLIRIWIAEGFVEMKRGVSLEETAKEYLDELIDRSLIQVMDKDFLGRCKSCCVNGFMHEVIKNKSKEENFAILYDIQQMERRTSHMVLDKIRRLAIQKSNPSEIGSKSSSSHLRSLILELGKPSFGGQKQPTITNLRIRVSQFKLLRVLDLEGTFIDFLPFEFTSSHILLKYLSLRNTKLVKLPQSLKKLQNLETLDLRGTFIIKIPREITKLKRLRHLFVPHPPYENLSSTKDDLFIRWFTHSDYRGVELPTGIVRLQALWDLSLVDAFDASVVKEQGELTQLRKLGIRRLTREGCTELCAVMEKMSSLISITLLSMSRNEPLLLGDLNSPPLLLERLFLAGPLEYLPVWFSSLSHLNKLVLVGSGLQDDPFTILQKLPNLVVLFLVDAYGGSILQANTGNFKKLKHLHISNSIQLRRLVVQKGAMRELESLSIWFCAELEQVPLGIGNITGLKELHLLGMPKGFIDSLRKDRVHGHPDIAHIQRVKCSFRSEGEWNNEVF
ncbi:Nbs-lrr resistance protein [Rhynchospora pubera]|uniref:Nbs-lrr resistance protein n=1 Tax=Rhynchospora pubera TaxID=906938 RepID=A0AAV8HC26_9POAL|nr:Nbs-lrr resistance protein [Rhynchospora pubera]